MKRNRFIKKCGPYEVFSVSQGGDGVRLEVYPAFPQYNITEKRQQEKDIDSSWAKDPRWPIHRYKGEGGGPSIFTAIALAKEFEEFLNQSYIPEQVEEWKKTNAEALKKVRDRAKRNFERAMARQEERAMARQEKEFEEKRG